jgi:maltose/moltooligosaccharide transporter
MSFGFGNSNGFALQNSNVSRIFQTLGANIDDIPFMGSRSYDWLNYPTYNWLFFRQDLDKIRTKKTLLLAGAILASAALYL